MKNNIKRIFFAGGLLLSLLATNSCQRDLTSLNEDPKHPSSVPSANLLATGLYQEFYYIHTGSVNFNNYRFFTQYWTETQYTSETNYDLITRAQPRNHFNRMYVYALNSFHQAQINLPTEVVLDQDITTNKWASLEIASISVWENVVDTYGNVPYSEALQAETIKSPKYDDAKSIYTDLLKRIDVAIAKINTSKIGYATNEDIVYKGSMAKWKKLANSIKLRLAINLADVDPATAKSAAESAIASGIIASEADSYSLAFDGGVFTNPLYDDMVASGRNDFIPSSIFVNPMNTASDPRRAAYFTPLTNGTYKGGVYGTLNVFANFSHVNPTFTSGAAPGKLLSYTEVLFLKAEAAARGFSAGDTAANLYAAAVTASMTENGVSVVDATAYVAAHPFNASNWQQSIGYEAWIALWNSPFASWNFTRRLDYPVLNAPAQSYIGGIPYRMPYSDQEYVINNANVSAAATAIGGDEATTKLFWDIH